MSASKLFATPVTQGEMVAILMQLRRSNMGIVRMIIATQEGATESLQDAFNAFEERDAGLLAVIEQYLDGEKSDG